MTRNANTPLENIEQNLRRQEKCIKELDDIIAYAEDHNHDGATVLIFKALKSRKEREVKLLKQVIKNRMIDFDKIIEAGAVPEEQPNTVIQEQGDDEDNVF